MATRSRLTWRPDSRGYYTHQIGWERSKTGKSQQHKFLLGTDRREATTNTWPVVDIIRPHVKELVVGNPLKTDKIDAEVLAQLLRCEYLPDVWQPDAMTQVQRSLLTHRSGLMCQRA